MAKKLRVGLLFGGRSAEHEISIISARNVADALDPDAFEVVPIGIDREGKWLTPASSYELLKSASSIQSVPSSESVALSPGSYGELTKFAGGSVGAVDVVFPILHGPFGEDGTVQGLLKLANVPFVGCGVLASALAMDKDVAKRLLRDAGIPVARFVVMRRGEKAEYKKIAADLGEVLFVKPANLGSSVGIAKVRSEKEFDTALEDAFRYDNKVLIEEYIQGREIECAVLGSGDPEASVVGEVVVNHDFYSYEAKYLDEKGATLEIPANIPEKTAAEVRALAVKAFRTLECEGMARVDLFLTKEGALYVNELNTIPGFTNISMYPKLWEATGIPYKELIRRLIELAIERHEHDARLKTGRT